MSFRTTMIALGLTMGALSLAPDVRAGSVSPLMGELFGEVENSAGVAQMGAKVYLYNRYDQLVREALTNETGKFVFESLAPDVYSIRVALASFVPAMRSNIAVTAGSENLLKINLASILSTVELVPASTAKGTLMTDDWKWVLRTSQATRPVLRLAPAGSSSRHHNNQSLLSFSDTTGVVKLSAGDAQSAAGSATQAMGTAFGIETVVNGSAQVRLSGKVGYMANSGLPAAGFRATYSRNGDGIPGPQISFTGHQIYFPGLGANPSNEQATGTTGPVMRIASLGAMNKDALSDHLQVEYGGHIDAVSFLQREGYLSPFVRTTYDFGKDGSLRVAYSNGAIPTELVVYDAEPIAQEGNTDLNQDLAALSHLPQMSRSDGRLRLERTQNWEAGYEVVQGSRKYSARVYRENVTDAALTLSGPPGLLAGNDLLPDFASSNYVFDLGDYSRTGFSGAVTQSTGDNMEFTVAAGYGGALTADSQKATAQTAEDIRALIHKANRSWVTVRASATIPGGGTRVITSYGWTDFQSLMPTHFSLTGVTYQGEGLDIYIRQPLPRMKGMRGRMEATAELLNALAQGYLPVSVGGHTAVLTNSPRALRGGLSFLF